MISVSGDGGFTMLMGDFLTLTQHDLPVKVVVFNNGALCLGAERENQPLPWSDRAGGRAC